MTKEKQGNPSPPQANPDLESTDLPSMNRRSFFTRTLVGGGLAVATGGATVAASKASLKGKIDPVGIEIDEKNFKPMDQRDVVLTYAHGKHLHAKYPERDEQYTRLQKTDFKLTTMFKSLNSDSGVGSNRTGYTQIDRALGAAGSDVLRMTGSIFSKTLQPNTVMYTWEQMYLSDTKYDFGSDERARDMVYAAARCYGALRVGVAKFDKRFAYDPMYDLVEDKTLTWEEDFPFEPKSVITVVTPEDYDCVAMSPSWGASAANNVGYTQMMVTAVMMAGFLRRIGYKAVASGSDMVNGTAYGVLAGLGEVGRNAQLIMPGIGPRGRLSQIITDLDFGDAYEQPRSWGIVDFCKSCAKCADSCPSGALSHDVEPSFYPTYEFSDEPGYTWNTHTGVKKWHTDCKKCLHFWSDNDGSCQNCKASCTFNEPDFWHHWMIAAINPMMPGFVHKIMAESHPAFGYGGQGPMAQPEKVKKFWDSGKGMRTNLSTKDNAYTSGKS